MSNIGTKDLTLRKFDHLPNNGREIVAAYLKTKVHSPGAVRNARSFLDEFFSVVNKHPLEVRKSDWRLYAEHLNARDVLQF